MKSLAFFLCLFSLATSWAKPFSIEDLDPAKTQAYILQFQHIAIAEMDRAGIPASIKMAQGILESGSGASQLAIQANNHFGIKCGGKKHWDGPSFYLWDDETVKSCFRVYDQAEKSYIAHSEFLHNPKKAWRYGFLFDLDKTDYKAWAKGLQKAGYATAKTYSKNLISIIERYELYRLDHLSFQDLQLAPGELDSIFNLQPPPKDSVKGPEERLAIRIPDPFGEIKDTVELELPKGIIEVNGRKAMVLQVGESLNELAQRANIKLKKLERYNDFAEQGRPRAGQYVFLQRKKKRYTGEQHFHILRKGQDLRAVSQYYGIRLKSLEKLNKIYHETLPKTGNKIRLKKEN